MSEDPLKHSMVQGDLEDPIRRQIVNVLTGLPFDLTGATVRFIMNKEDFTAKIDVLAGIENPPSLGFVRYDWQAGDTDDIGNFPAHFQITFASGRKKTYPPSEEDPGKSFIFVLVGRKLAT